MLDILLMVELSVILILLSLLQSGKSDGSVVLLLGAAD